MTQNTQYIPKLLQDLSVVFVISETCLAEVKRRLPTFTDHPTIHFISSGQSFLRKVEIHLSVRIDWYLYTVGYDISVVLSSLQA